LQIRDLPAPVTAAKADWLPGTHWLGFTPMDGSGAARERCRATINSQVRGGYVIEYVTRKFGDPNPGFQADPRYLTDKAAHSEVAGKFLAVHRLRPSSRPLRAILGDQEFSSFKIFGPMATNATVGRSRFLSSKVLPSSRRLTPAKYYRPKQ
jgi:5-methylcytosine-specific restriction protein A